MSNTVTWSDPDTTQAQMGGNKAPAAFYQIDPVTNKAVSPGGGGGGGGAVTDVTQTGTISADQGAVTAAFGAGVASWSVDARGTFSAGSTLIFEYLLDSGTDYNSAFGVPIGSTSDQAVSSVVGGAPISYQGNAAGFQKFRVRCHPFQGGDNVAVTIIGSVATDGGFVSKSLPPGTNKIGGVTLADGDNTTFGAEADAAAAADTSTATYMSLFKRLLAKIPLIGPQVKAASTSITVATDDNNIGVNGDAAVVGDNAGSLSAKLRGLSKILNDIWDSVNHRLHVNVDNAQALGQTTKSASTSVTIASDQSSSAQPLTVEQTYQTAIRASHAFKITTGALTATVGPYMALSLWNPNGSGKTAHVTRITSYYETTANHPYLYLYKETSDPSTGWTTPAALTPVCMDLGSGNTSVLTVNRTNTGQAASLTGTVLHTQDTGAGVNVEAIAGGSMEEIKIPPNSGLTIYLNAINTTQFGLTVSLFEETV